MSARRRMTGFLCALLALGVAFYVLPGQRLLIWTAIGLAAAGAVAVGVRRFRPRRRSAWWLVAAALLALTLSEAVHFVEARTVDRGVFPTIADALYLGAFIPLMLAGVWRLVRSGVRLPDRVGLLDTLIITTAAAVVSWAFLISPLVLGNTYTFLQKAVAVAYPVSGVLVLAAVVRLAANSRWTAGLVWPVIGMLGMLGSGAAYGMVQLQSGWRVGGLIVLGWVALFAGWGAGALHPSMADITASRTVRHQELTRPRLVILAVAAMIAPLALLIEATRDLPFDVTVRRALTVVLFVFLLLRLYVAVDSQLRAITRERGLRSAGAALVEATSSQDAVTAVRTAVERLLPPGVPHEVVIEVGGTVLPTAPAGSRTGLARAVASARPPPARTAAPSHIHLLDPPLGDQPGIPEAVLRCQLSLTHAVTGTRNLGALYVAADELLLQELEPSVEVVASQAALALERIRLTDEISRRASEEYFRTLVHNAADVILIVDDDDTVRYASPSAATVLGVERPGRLHDLIPPDDRPVVDRTLRLLRQRPEVPVRSDWVVLAADGRCLQAEAVCRDLRADHTVGGVVITLRDVTEQRRLQQELTHLAFHDPLTGLANRARLRERLDEALARTARDGTVAGLLFLDVDDLKVVNDTLGHTAGDELLVATGQRLAGALRQQDTAARLGGDEFAALIVGVRSEQEVEQVAQRIVASFVEPFTLTGYLVTRAVSVGVATTAETRDGDELMRQADLALYVAKRAGKSQWRRYGGAQGALAMLAAPGPPPDRPRPPTPTRPRATVLDAPVPAAAAGGVDLSGWPLIDDPRPAELMARPTGLIVPVGSWILETLLADAATRRYPVTVAGQPPVRVDVSAHLGQVGSLAFVRTALEAVAASPHGLVRITERSLFGNAPSWLDLASMQAIVERTLGLRVAAPDDSGRRGVGIAGS